MMNDFFTHSFRMMNECKIIPALRWYGGGKRKETSNLNH
jgi:hypothetical protein